MFDGQEMSRWISGLNKSYWVNTMEMMSAFHNQTGKMCNTLLEQGMGAQQEGKKMLQDWLNRTKQAQDQFAETMEKNWEKAEASFVTTPKTGK
jgi:polyhydroxyalkanoate synthesis regulator phasin